MYIHYITRKSDLKEVNRRADQIQNLTYFYCVSYTKTLQRVLLYNEYVKILETILNNVYDTYCRSYNTNYCSDSYYYSSNLGEHRVLSAAVNDSNWRPISISNMYSYYHIYSYKNVNRWPQFSSMMSHLCVYYLRAMFIQSWGYFRHIIFILYTIGVLHLLYI